MAGLHFRRAVTHEFSNEESQRGEKVFRQRTLRAKVNIEDEKMSDISWQSLI